LPDHLFPVLLADIGGTNARFRVLEDPQTEARIFETVAVQDFDTIEEAINGVVIAAGGARPRRAIIAAAGPIRADGMDFTNSPWEVRPEPFLKKTGIEALTLVNDFAAQALALPVLADEDLVRIGGGEVMDGRTKVVLGPGTGLGVGQLVRADGTWVPVPGEGGHVDLGPRTDWEAAIWEHLDRVDGRVSAEQVLSGRGLVNLYRAVCKADDTPPLFHDPSHVTTAALAAHERREEDHTTLTVQLFATCLGRVAGDMALTAYAQGGVYLAGGIPTRILPFLTEGPFRQSFEDKAPHGNLLRNIATMVIKADLPALCGLAALAREPDSYAIDLARRTWTV
jgi:glucokinase